MKYLILATFCAFSFFAAGQAMAATLSVSAPGSVNAGDIVTARILVDSQGVAINNAEAALMFPPDVVSVVSVSKSNSIFSLWVEEPTFSNSIGRVTFNGGVPNPGFTGSAGSIISITFLAQKTGTATLSLANAAVRANDGNGTDVLTSAGSARISVTSPAPAPVAPTPTPTPATTPVRTPVSSSFSLRSSTHPDQNMWYAKSEPRMEWTLPAGASSIQTGVGPLADALPSVTYTPPVNSKTLDALEDGTWYFKIRHRTADGWSTVSVYRLNIDTEIPVIGSHEFLYVASQGLLMIRAKATDSLSGVDRYEMQIDEAEPVPASVSDMESRSFGIEMREPGLHHVTMTVFDKAGNRASVEGSFVVPESIENQAFLNLGFFTLTLLQAFIAMFVLALLSLIVAVASSYRLYRYRMTPRLPLPKVRKDLHHGFELMREDLTKDIHMLDDARRKRDLTREEQTLYKRIASNLSDLEKFLNRELDRLE